MVKRWLAALSGRSKRSATTRDPKGDRVSGARREFGRAAGLLDRYHQIGDLGALTEAVTSCRRALAMIPTGHPGQTAILNTLGIALRNMFERSGDLQLLTEAVTLGREALAATPIDHPERAGQLIIHGNILWVLFERIGNLPALFEQTEQLSVLAEAREAFAEAAASPAASVAVRINACRGLGNTAMLAGEPETALSAFEAAVEMVPRILARSDREYGVGRLAGLASEVAAAAVATGRPGRAVELLEQTRGLLLGEAIDARSDLTELRRATPALAAEFDNLRARAAALEDAAAGLLGFPAQPTAALTDTTLDVVQQDHRRQATQLGEQRRQLAEQWTALVGRIRATAGWEQFLRPPPIARLHRQASAGPIVVVYVSRWRADALIMTSDPAHPVQVVPLPGLTEGAVYEQANRLLVARAAADGDDVTGRAPAQREVHAVLGWLWDTVTGPVLDHLGITGEPGWRPRIWWCPVGVLAYLPLHAAGHHTDPAGTPASRTVLDRAVCSYTITLRALEHARAHRDTPQVPAGSSVIIAMPTTPQAPDLPAVHGETQALARLLGSPLILAGPAATHQAVAAALPRHRIAHFACHGLSDWANPATSRLLLADHASAPLTVTALMRLHLADADLAYLSACSTARTSPQLTDEAVHLTAAVQLAGYRHVIGTLWPINDTAAVHIATDVYSHLTNGGTRAARTEDSAHALAEATRGLRDAYPALPTRWAAHLHLGP